jgi:hypothetical protein
MNKGTNSAPADFGPRPEATTQAQWPKRPDGPSQPARGHCARDRRGGVAAGAGNGDEVGR